MSGVEYMILLPFSVGMTASGDPDKSGMGAGLLAAIVVLLADFHRPDNCLPLLSIQA